MWKRFPRCLIIWICGFHFPMPAALGLFGIFRGQRERVGTLHHLIFAGTVVEKWYQVLVSKCFAVDISEFVCSYTSIRFLYFRNIPAIILRWNNYWSIFIRCSSRYGRTPATISYNSLACSAGKICY